VPLSDASNTLPESNSNKSTVEDIQSGILLRICFLDYRPGDQLKEADLAKEFGVSRTPVRDAISRINHLGLVETRNGVGTVVVSLSDDEVMQVYEMRLHLATLIGRTTPTKIEEAYKSQATDLLRQANALVEEFNLRSYIILNHQLNILIASLIGNIVLRSFWLQTYYQAASTWYRVGDIVGPDVARALVDELTEINAALAANDLEAVGYIQRIHIGYGFERIRKHLF
jgi:DNA-binding GntR family transcriptional regulator